jgi:hypothetical protein
MVYNGHHLVFLRDLIPKLATCLGVQILNTHQHLSTSCFYENTRGSNVCGYKILTEGVFVTRLSSNALVSV